MPRSRRTAAQPQNWVTLDRASTLLSYDPDTGAFQWLVEFKFKSLVIKPGDYAGTINSDGYIKITIDGRTYLAHRLAFLFMTGKWPRQTVDHRDRDRTNNSWNNLRDVSQGVNNQNRGITK